MKSRLATALVAALILGAGLLALSCKGKSNPAGPGGTADVTININGNLGGSSFSPNPDTVSVGKTVSWHNLDGITHTSTATGLWTTNNIAGGATSAPIQMNTVGSFGYHCSIHTTMTGTLVVK